jgi:hypothetical protein
MKNVSSLKVRQRYTYYPVPGEVTVNNAKNLKNDRLFYILEALKLEAVDIGRRWKSWLRECLGSHLRIYAIHELRSAVPPPQRTRPATHDSGATTYELCIIEYGKKAQRCLAMSPSFCSSRGSNEEAVRGELRMESEVAHHGELSNGAAGIYPCPRGHRSTAFELGGNDR